MARRPRRLEDGSWFLRFGIVRLRRKWVDGYAWSWFHNEGRSEFFLVGMRSSLDGLGKAHEIVDSVDDYYMWKEP